MTVSFCLENVNLFLIDMDDTLYEERDFVMSGFRAVADHLGGTGCDREKVWQYLRQRFETEGRGRIFDHLLYEFIGGDVSETDVDACVTVYRQHTPTIALYPGVRELLDILHLRGRIVVVTDGMPSVQRNKFRALGLDSLVDQLVCCWDYAPKPDPASLAGVVEQGQADALYIGDDPARDLGLAEALGIDCIRVRTGRFAEVPNEPHQPLADLSRFADLARVLQGDDSL